MSRQQMNRRSWLRGLIGSGALVGLDAMFTAKRTDAAQVGPNDKIKVSKIETFVLKNSWVFVKISTDARITGWGEMLKDDAKACAAGALGGQATIWSARTRARVVQHWQAIHRGVFLSRRPHQDGDLEQASIRRSGILQRQSATECPPINFLGARRATESVRLRRRRMTRKQA